MLEATDTKHAPWYIVRSDDKKRARLNCISHLLSLIPYKKLPREKVKIPSAIQQGQVRRPRDIARKEFYPGGVMPVVTRFAQGARAPWNNLYLNCSPVAFRISSVSSCSR